MKAGLHGQIFAGFVYCGLAIWRFVVFILLQTVTTLVERSLNDLIAVQKLSEEKFSKR
jgi:hypothetical protein